MRKLIFLLGVAVSPALAADWLSVVEPKALLYDAPSRQATPLYVVTRQYPLERVVEVEGWVKVRDHTGALSWIEKRALTDKRTVVVTEPRAEAHVRPEDGAPVAFVAAQSVALELVDAAPPGWLHVRHADGENGFLRAAAVWGD